MNPNQALQSRKSKTKQAKQTSKAPGRGQAGSLLDNNGWAFFFALFLLVCQELLRTSASLSW
jgi:hypothetical protein